MTDPQTAEVAVDAVTGFVNTFKDTASLYWLITLYSVVVGAAMTYVGRRYFKTLLFLVGAFSVYVPVHCFASELIAIVCAVVAGLVMILMYPVFVFIMGVTVWAIVLIVCGVEPGQIGTIHALIGCVFGVAAIIFRKHIVIPVSAWSGAWLLALGLAFLFGGMNPILFALLGLLFTGSGILVQYKFTAKDIKDEKRKEVVKKQE